MPATELVAEPLEDLDLGMRPPCQMILQDDSPCKNPAILRIHMYCTCDCNPFIFLCGSCLRELQVRNVHCTNCGNSNFAWQEA